MKGRKNTPKAAGNLLIAPDPPPHFTEPAITHWRKLTAMLMQRRLLSDDDLAALAVLAGSLALYQQAQEKIDIEGAVVMGQKGEIKSPWVTIQNQAWDRIRPLLSEFGLTPCARAKFKSDDGDEDDFLDGGGWRDAGG